MVYPACCLPICKFAASKKCINIEFLDSHHNIQRPGQEEGNVPFVENSGFGKYSGNPTVIADTVSSWLSTPEKMESMKAAALAAARPSATLDIAKDLAEIAFAKKLTKERAMVRVR